MVLTGLEITLFTPLPLYCYLSFSLYLFSSSSLYLSFSSSLYIFSSTSLLCYCVLKGNISRQEAVSMIPPLLLDVLPHHKVYIMSTHQQFCGFCDNISRIVKVNRFPVKYFGILKGGYVFLLCL